MILNPQHRLHRLHLRRWLSYPAHSASTPLCVDPRANAPRPPTPSPRSPPSSPPPKSNPTSSPSSAASHRATGSPRAPRPARSLRALTRTRAQRSRER
jgi:hypothetical protein